MANNGRKVAATLNFETQRPWAFSCAPDFRGFVYMWPDMLERE
nr:MetaGeneMark_Unknown Function [uncultured bacterium]